MVSRDEVTCYYFGHGEDGLSEGVSVVVRVSCGVTGYLLSNWGRPARMTADDQDRQPFPQAL
uniref:Uncharacterized protein n=1 Tax=Rhizobium leguminosarum bv. viciae TaxID=387 RepID=A0A0U3I645_RHILV|nr:hypothetical protein [Rhizobium leguminosarum bv. viciae]